ncbi:MAG: hypothetical protein LBN35_04555, partial [Clostridiales Family XIII bacterium]|nr:hypothetical protein [Clostridiales Family XIII bacterium]
MNQSRSFQLSLKKYALKVVCFAMAVCIFIGMSPMGVFADVTGTNGIKVYIGDDLVYDGTGIGPIVPVAGIDVTSGGGNTLTITAASANSPYAGLTISGGTASDSVTLSVNGNVTF